MPIVSDPFYSFKELDVGDYFDLTASKLRLGLHKEPVAYGRGQIRVNFKRIRETRRARLPRF